MKPPVFNFVCDEPWETMTGDHRVCRCARCDRDVHALAAHARGEVVALLSRSERVCAQVATWDGKLLTAARVVVAYVADLSADRVDLVLLSNARPEIRGGDLKLSRPRIDRFTENLADHVERLRALRATCPASAAEAAAFADEVLEQADAVLAERDVSMYADLQTFLEDAVDQLVAAGCEPAVAPAP